MKNLFVILFFVSSVAAQTPDWVTNQGNSNKFPNALFITGYGVASSGNGVSSEQAVKNSLESARKNLIEKISIKIQSVTSLKTEETGDKFSSFFNSAVQSASNLEVQGLENARFYEKEIAHSFVYVKREVLQNSYQQKVQNLKSEIESKLKIAKNLEEHKKSTQAMEEYLSCLPLIRQLEESQTILTFVKTSNVLSELEQTAASNEITIAKIREAIAKLVQRPIASVDDLAWYIVFQLKEQIEQKEKLRISVFVAPLLYQDTKMGSSFSRFFNHIIEQKIGEAAKWDVVQANAQFLLNGSYWDQGDKIKFIVNLRSITDGKILASAEATVENKIISASGKNIKPENVQAALQDQKIFAEGENAGGGLTVEAWTNKQTQGNLFILDEQMKVTVRVNMPAYIRFIYHLADGTRILLMNDYYIDQSKVNLAYEIPQDLECAAPFGSEVLQIFARTDKFEQVQTKSVNGYNYLAEDLQKFVTKTRGMKAAKPKTMQAETRINITTMKE